MSPLISVIVPTYNSEKFVIQAIASVLSQTYPHYEIIVIDDGSVDNTKHVLQEFSGSIRYFYQENRGPSSARNHGIQVAKGAYICFLDADDLWTPDKLAKQLEFMERHQNITLVFSDHEDFSEEGSLPLSWLGEKKKVLGQDFVMDVPLQGAFSKLVWENFISTPTVMIRKACFETTGVFDEKLWSVEDRDLWLRIAAHFQIACLPITVCKRRIHQSNVSKMKKLSMQARITVLEKNHRCFSHLAPAVFWHRRISDCYRQLGYILLAKGNRSDALKAGIKSLVHAVGLLRKGGSYSSYPWLLSLGLIPGALLGWRFSKSLYQPIKPLPTGKHRPESKRFGDV